LFRKKQKKAGRVVTHTLADGTKKQYRYTAYQPKRPSTRFHPDSLEALLRSYRASPEWQALRPETVRFYNTYLRPIEEISQCAAADYSRRELMEMRNSIASERGNGAATAFIRAASALFTWAVQNEWLERSPVHKVKPLPHGELRAWTAQEADQAQAALPEHLRRVVILARYTAQRRGDLAAMLWSAFDGQTIRVNQQKTGAELVIPCHPILAAELAAWPRDAVTILTNTDGRPWHAGSLSHVLPRALARLGMPDGLNMHGLRKLAAAELAEAGCTEKEIAAITGHRTLSMVQHYTKSADQPRLAGAAILKLQRNTKRS
jgi:integrase